MREQLLGSELRDFCQEVGLLNANQDFSDRRDIIIPTVRIVRTLIVNYLKGKTSQETDFHMPIVCKSGGMDAELNDYKIKIKKGLNANIDIMNVVSKKVFRKPLQKKLIDLKL